MFLFLLSACKQDRSGGDINHDISVSQASKLNSEGYLFIDMRTKEEIQSDGKIDGSIHIDFKADDFEKKIALLPKDKKYIAYCAGGGRSAKSMPIFNKYNIQAYNMLGGYGQWRNSNN